MLSALMSASVSAKGDGPDSYKKWKHKPLLLEKEDNYRFDKVMAYWTGDSCAFEWKSEGKEGVYKFSNQGKGLGSYNFYSSDVNFVNAVYSFVTYLQNTPNRYEWIQAADFIGVHNKYKGDKAFGLGSITGFDSFGAFWGMSVSKVYYNHTPNSDIYELTLEYNSASMNTSHQITITYEGDSKTAKKETVCAYVKNIHGQWDKRVDLEIKDEE